MESTNPNLTLVFCSLSMPSHYIITNQSNPFLVQFNSAHSSAGPGTPKVPDLLEVRCRWADPTKAQWHSGHPSRTRQADPRCQDRNLEEPDGARCLVEHSGRSWGVLLVLRWWMHWKASLCRIRRLDRDFGLFIRFWSVRSIRGKSGKFDVLDYSGGR